MATLNEIIYNIKNLRGGGTETDDSKLTRRQLEFIINHFRAELATQRTNQGKSLEGFIQDLTGEKFIPTKDFRAVGTDVSILKSATTIPIPVVGYSGFVIPFVGLRDEYYGYQKSTVRTFNLELEHPFIQNTYFVVNNYMYIATKNRSTQREVFIRGVFADPREALRGEGDINLEFGFDWNYPIPEGTISQLNSLIINNEYRWMNMLPADQLNNGRDDKDSKE